MILAAALLAVCSLPQTGAVKVVIDGTIDFGPNWNFEYKLEPVHGFEPRKTISNNHNTLMNNNNVNVPKEEPDADTKIIEVINRNGEDFPTVAQDELSDNFGEEKTIAVTKLYQEHENAKNKNALFKNPRKIKNEKEVIQFVDHIKNESLKMFDDVREKFDNKAFVQKIIELKQRYTNKFNDFQKNTKHHTIRTALGNQKVILNTIDYSNRLLNRLFNRFKIDMADFGLRSGFEASKIFQEHKDNLRNNAYEDACKMFSICRAGKEFSDHISALITALLEHDDNSITSTIEATAKALKSADFSRIMDAETQEAYKKGLSILEEMNPFELRVILMAYKLLLDNRHQPFVERDPKDVWVRATVAMFDVMEGFNKKIVLDPKDWDSIKGNFTRWLAGDEVDVRDVVSNLVNSIQKEIAELDKATAEDFKAKLRLCVMAKSLRISLTSYVHFQPFII